MNEDLYLNTKNDVMPQAMLIHSLRVLSRNADELRDLIGQAVAENPLLEYADDGYDMGEETAALATGERVSLRDHLLSQLRFIQCEPGLLQWCEQLIGCIDDDGYLRDELSELSVEWHVPEERLAGALRVVQTLEPCGAGARSLQECLEIQLRNLPDTELELRIVGNHLEALADGSLDLPEIDPDRLEYAVTRIRMLQPHPGAAFDVEPTRYLLPDIEITFEEDTISVGLANQPNVPRITPLYKEWLQGGSESQRHYAKDCLIEARELLFAIEQRARTLLCIAELAAGRQKNFFASGNMSDLQQLTMTETAAVLGMSLSTVSRAVQDKHYAYRGKLYPLRQLFPRGGTGEHSRLWIIERIGQLEKHSPKRMSDERLAELLCSEGIVISRRTVNKYRGELQDKEISRRRRSK